MASLIDKCRTKKHYPLAMYRSVISKETRSYVTVNIDDGIPSLSSDSATTSKRKNNRRDRFKLQIKNHCLSLKAQDDALFRNRSKKTVILIKPLNSMLDHVVDRLSLQKLEYKMGRVVLPDDYIFFEIGYCGHPPSPNARIQREQYTKLIILHFH